VIENNAMALHAEEPLEVEVTTPVGPTDDGGAVVQFGEEQQGEPAFGDNFAEFIEEKDLSLLASELVQDFESDRDSRSEWEKTYIKGLDLLGLKFEERNQPWDGACGVFHPLLAESVVRFQAQTIQEVFPASGPAKTSIVGNKSPEKTKQAMRVQEYLNYMTTSKMKEYRTETEKLLFSLPLAGSCFRKVYHDQTFGRPFSMYVPAEDFVVNYGTADLSTCERATHLMKKTPNWVRKRQVAGFYRDIDLPDTKPELTEIDRKYNELKGESADHDLDDRHILLEMQVDLDLIGFEDGTGIALPYVVTVEKGSREILSIYRNWKEDDPLREKRDHVVHYQYLPGLGFYGFGLTHMIGGLSKSATSLLRQLVDSGTLANLPGGLKSRGLRIKGDDTPIAPGEFRDVDVPSGAIRDNITFLPYKEPSSVLYQLLGDLVSEGRRFASAADLKAADMNAEAPVGTTLAILEREMKVISAIQARIHHAMGQELVILTAIIREQGPQEYPYEVDGEYTITDDFDARIDVIPVSDPNAGTMAQRIMQYQAALQLAASKPEMYDLPFLHRQMLEVLGIGDADKIVPMSEDMLPQDPITETQSLLTGKPIRAFLYQDHEAHIQAHLAAAEHPQLLALMEKNPNAKQVAASAAAHLAEHLAMAYRYKIEQELGVEMPDPDMPLPEDIEIRLSRLVAPAAAQLTGKAAQQAQAEENAKKQEDPIIQQAKRELDIKQEAQDSKEMTAMEKIKADLQKASDKMKLDRERLDLEWEKLEEAKRKARKVEALSEDKLDLEEEKMHASAETAGLQSGANLASAIISSKNKDKSK